MNTLDYTALVNTLNLCLEKARTGHLTLGEVLDSIEEAGFCFISVLLVLPFLQPFSLGPLASIGGLMFAALGWQLYRGHTVPMLPEKVRVTEMSVKTWEKLIRMGIKFLDLCKKITRPRYQHWVMGERGRRVIGLTIIAAGLLMAIPLFGIPMNNMLPGLAILCVCVAELEKDGMMVFIAFGWLVVTVLYFAGILIAIWIIGTEVLEILR